MRQVFNWLLDYWSRFADLLFPDKDKKQLGKVAEDIANQPMAKIYYSIPGKTFIGFIDKGRVLKTENKWPLTGKK